MQEFISKHIICHYPKVKTDVPLDSMDDSAVVDGIVFTTDGHTVKPLIFRAGISEALRSGNRERHSRDGRRALALSCSLVLEAGLDLDIVDGVLRSMGRPAESAASGGHGDTKVVEAGGVDEMIVVTSAIGRGPLCWTTI